MNYDAIIIGSGQAGPPLAHRLAEVGQKVALIEKEFFGGVCVNTGCVPTKAYVASARRAWSARNSSDLGVKVGQVEVDLTVIKQRKDDFVADASSGIEKKLKETENITVYEGTAKFTANKAISINGKSITAEQIFINVGARPSIPDGFAKGSFMTNRDILELAEIPEHLIVVGGSYIGLEFGQMFHRFGSKVTIVETNDHLVSREDEDISECIECILKEAGIELRLGANCVKANRENGKVVVDLECNDGDPQITGTHLLVATGRQPNSDLLELGNTDIETDDQGYIKVNNKLETTVPGVYALGDVNGEGAFTHTAYNDFEIVAANLLDGGDRKVSDRIMTYGLFIDPPLARVGMTEKEARDEGYQITIVTKPMGKVSRANHKGETQGMLKIVANAKNRQLLGAAFLGIGSDELIYAITDLMYSGQSFDKITEAVHIHPTVGEYLPSLLGELVPHF